MSDTRPQLKDLTLDALRAHLAASGEAPWRADQIAAWVYTRGVEDPAAMTDFDVGGLDHSFQCDWFYRVAGEGSETNFGSPLTESYSSINSVAEPADATYWVDLPGVLISGAVIARSIRAGRSIMTLSSGFSTNL